MAKVRALIPSLRGTVRLGGMTDCFQPAERRVRNTWKTINLLNAAGVPYLIVTKSALVAAPEYLRLYDPQLAHVQVSVTATSDEGGREYEKASPISARIAAAEKLAAAGIDTALRLSPYIPRLVDPAVLAGVKVGEGLRRVPARERLGEEVGEEGRHRGLHAQGRRLPAPAPGAQGRAARPRSGRRARPSPSARTSPSTTPTGRPR